MKSLHRKDLYSWSVFNENLDIDFNSYAWIREGGNVLIDPLPLGEHDRKHLEKLGGAAWIVLTNSDHVRGARDIAAWTGAKIAGPAGEKGGFPIECDLWLADGDEVVPGLMALTLEGSKTPGELVLLLDETTLITGDLVRSHRAGRLMMLPEPKIKDRSRAVASLGRLLEHDRIDAILVGDGWSLFRDGHARLEELLVHLTN
jgi:glyoxylase-like metal-dependent hydrolase (beta-lactamase superfamily II)